jgi:hypothetical protein
VIEVTCYGLLTGQSDATLCSDEVERGVDLARVLVYSVYRV